MKMSEIQKIKKAFFEEGLNKNQISKQYHRSWETVSRIINTPLEQLEEQEEQRGGNRQPTVGTSTVKDTIRKMLLNEKDYRIKKKQKLTGTVIYRELVEKGIYSGSPRRLQEIIQQLKKDLELKDNNSYLPLHFLLGSVLQVDHGEVTCIIDDLMMICFLFIASIPGTSIRYSQLFPRKSRESWGEFHERTFKRFGGIFPKCVYDNDTVLINDTHTKRQTEFASYLVEHYKFTPHYCNPASGNEKGSVENGVGYCRRNYFPGMPKYPNFDVVNQMLDAKFMTEIATGKDYKTGEPLMDVLKKISQSLQPLFPSKTWWRREKRIVNSYQCIEVEGHYYSVPKQYVGNEVTIFIMSFDIAIRLDLKEVTNVVHKRQFSPGADSLHWGHYLEQLQQKPGALWDCKATQGLLRDPLIEQAWNLTLLGRSLREAQREFVNILFLRRKYEEAKWRNAVSKFISINRMKSEEVEAFLKLEYEPEMQETPLAVREKLPHLDMPGVDFFLDPYSELCGGKSC